MTFLQFTHVVQAQFFQHMFGGGQAFEQREQEVPPVSHTNHDSLFLGLKSFI